MISNSLCQKFPFVAKYFQTLFETNVNTYLITVAILFLIHLGLYGIFNFDLVSAIFMGDRSVGAIITYVIIALAAIWLIVYTVFANGILRFTNRRDSNA